jgi:Na+:H+ antiporter, NhaA family
VPIVPLMPHTSRDLGLYDPREELRDDTLNTFEHWWAVPVQFVLLLFGFANAGVPFAQIGNGTYYVLLALLVGKPAGIWLLTRVASATGASLSPGLRFTDVFVVGVVASIGFTVSLFFATAAFPEDAALAETKMGALLSFVAAPLAYVAARMLAVNRPTI